MALSREGKPDRGSRGLRECTPEVLAVRAARRGAEGRQAFGVLVEMFEERLYNFVLRRCRDRQQAEDVTQETFLRAWERVESYDPSWRFSTWLYTIANRQAVSRYRRLGREARGVEAPDTAVAPSADEATERAEGQRVGRVLWALAGEHLSEEQHTALWLRYAEDMSIEEIGRVLGKSSVAVRVCLFRARRALAGMLEKAESPGGMPERGASGADDGERARGSSIPAAERRMPALRTERVVYGGAS